MSAIYRMAFMSNLKGGRKHFEEYTPSYIPIGSAPAKALIPFDLTVDPIEFNSANVDSLLKGVFGSTTYPYRLRKIEGVESLNLRSQVLKLLCLMDAYRDSNFKLFDIDVVIYKSIVEGPSFTKFMKDLRMMMYVKLGGGKFLLNELNTDEKVKPFADITEIVPYNYLVNWKEPDEQDHLQSQIPVEIDQEMIREYRERVEYLLDLHPSPDKITVVKENEILFTSGSSQALKNSVYSDTEVKWKIRNSEKSLHFSEDPIKGRISKIQVGPGNLRYGLITNNQTSNSIRIIEKQIWEIVKKLPGSAMTNDPSELRRRIKSFFDPFRYYLSRDFQKEGWTKPLELVKVILEVLRNRFPSFPAWKYMSIFDHVYFLDGEQMYKCKRGHGIGFANSLTTIHSLAIYYMAVARCDITVMDECDSLAWNDDFCASFKSEKACEEYFECEELVMKGLSVLRKDKACFYGNGFYHFLENYIESNGVNKKIVLQRFLILQTICNCNIIAAKIYYSSASSVVERSISEFYFESIQDWYGYEFDRYETGHSITTGGWKNPFIFGVDTTCERGYTPLMGRCYRSMIDPISFLKEGKDEQHYFSPLERLYPDDVSIADEILKKEFYLQKSIGEMEVLLRKFVKSNNEVRRAFEKCLIERRTRFEQLKTDYSELEFYFHYKSNSKIDVIPPIDYSIEIPVEGSTNLDDSFMYESEDPIQEYFNSLKGEPNNFKYFLIYNLVYKRANQRLGFYFLNENTDLWGDWAEHLKNEDSFTPDNFEARDKSIDLREFYLNYNGVCKYYFNPSFMSIRVWKNLETNTLVELKKEVYNGFIPQDLLLICKERKITRSILHSLLVDSDFKSVVEDINEVLDEMIIEEFHLREGADVVEDDALPEGFSVLKTEDLDPENKNDDPPPLSEEDDLITDFDNYLVGRSQDLKTELLRSNRDLVNLLKAEYDENESKDFSGMNLDLLERLRSESKEYKAPDVINNTEMPKLNDEDSDSNGEEIHQDSEEERDEDHDDSLSESLDSDNG